jgi:hypothetical protein
VTLVGVGSSASKIITSNTSANIFTLSSCTGFAIEGMTLTATGTNSASAISLSACNTIALRDIIVNTSGGGTFLIPVVTSSSSTILSVTDCRLTAKAADATARALKLTGNTSVLVLGGLFDGLAGAAMEFAGTTSNVRVIGAAFGNTSANIGILWTSGMTGTDFTVVGCPTLRSAAGTITTPFDLSALSTNPRFRQWGNEVDGYATTTATGGANVTPDLSRGSEITISATSGGAGIVNVLTPTPGPSSVMRGYDLTLKLVNALGAAAAVTWTLAGTYKLVGAAAPSGVDGTTTIVKFLRDVDATVWREVCRASTTT